MLGSGGARGYAHIGVIEELEANGFAIRSIAGSSMGALIGGIYAAGKLRVFTEWVRPLQRLDVLRLLDWTISGGGFIKGDRIIGVLKDLIGETNIEDLPIPYTAVAVDLDVQREVWFSRGPLFDAIRASIAIPTIFRPYHYEGRLLVDGGLLNPLPVSPTLRDLTDCDDRGRHQCAGRAARGRRGHAETGDRGAAGQASPEMLPEGGKPAPIDVQRAGYRQRIAEFIEGMMEKRERTATASASPARSSSSRARSTRCRKRSRG